MIWRGLMRMFVCASLALPAPAAWAQGAPPSSPEPEPESEPSAAEYGAVATATRMARPVREVPAQVTVLERADIDLAPSLTTDSLLRSLPAVATFRRSSSLTADPSSQGLNLRGVGPSGVSRTLVLMDGVPANDPFGGWIYWRALPRLGLERVEVSPGGSSALYGSAALSGVVELHPRTARENAVQSEALYGSFHTFFGAVRVAHDFGPLGAAIEGEWLSSEGYPIVASAQRGPIDGSTPSAHGTVQTRVEAPVGSAATLWLTAAYFHEDQSAGTRLSKAEVGMGTSALGADVKLPHGGLLKLSGFGRFTRFEQQRARIAAGRLSESLSARQDVPAHDEGGAVVYQSGARHLGGEHRLAAGLDFRHISAESRERLFPAEPSAMSPARRDIEGQQLLLGVYLQDFYKVRPWLGIDAAVRFGQQLRLRQRRPDAQRAHGPKRTLRIRAEPQRERCGPTPVR